MPADGASVTLGTRVLELIHTPGHALHHYCIVDRDHELIFSGDTFGISYRDFDVDGREFIFPTTTPVHFDPDALCPSVDRLMSYQPQSIFLTHYAEVRDLPRLARQMKERVEAFADLGRRYRHAPDRAEQAPARHVRAARRLARRARLSARRCERHHLLDDDIELNCQGVEHWLDRK